MPLLSYAQNGEDIVLHRALRDVEAGHYVDIGACDPVKFSVTKLFYDRGWSGVNVEPSRAVFERLAAERARDRNFNLAVASRSGILRMHEVESTGLSTLVDDVAAAARERGFSSRVIDVPAFTLADICRDLTFETTHFLKIDVEGGEREVLQGADFTSFRPWIVVVEATAPLTNRRTDAAWRPLLERAGYACVLFDGLNLFFLAEEQAHLRERLEAPASVLDDFVPASLGEARRRASELEGRVDELSGEVARHDASVAARKTLHDAEVARLWGEIAEARLQARLSVEASERLFALLRRDAAREAERHREQMDALQATLAQLAHFQAQTERLHQIADLTRAGRLGDGRGGELIALRASLLRHAADWRAEVAGLEVRLDEALARAAALERSTSWRLTSPLRNVRDAAHAVRRNPRRLPSLARQGARALLRRADPSGATSDGGVAPPFSGTDTLVAVAGRLDGEIALIADLVEAIAEVHGADTVQDASSDSVYEEARIDEQLTRWVRAEVLRQRRSFL